MKEGEFSFKVNGPNGTEGTVIALLIDNPEDIFDTNMINLDDIVVEFNADMIGYCKTSEGGKRFRLSGTKDVEWIMEEIEKLKNELLRDTSLRGFKTP